MSTEKAVKSTENTPLLLIPPLNIPSLYTQERSDTQSKNVVVTRPVVAQKQELQPSTASDVQQSKSKRNALGMLLVTLGCFLLSTSYAILKYLMNVLGVGLFECIMLTHFIEHLIAWALWLSPDWMQLKPEYATTWYGEKDDRFNIWLRGVFYYGDLYLYWYGITIVPLGDAETIYLLIPILMAVGGRMFLKDPLSKTFALSFSLTVIGVIILCQPPFLVQFVHRYILHSNDENEGIYSDAQPISVKGVIYLVCGCLSWVCMNLMVRKSQKAHWIQFELTTTLQAWLVWTPILMFIDYASNGGVNTQGTWRFSWEILGLIAVCAVLFCGGLVCYVLGYQFGSSTKVCWFEYTALLLGYLYQITVFNHFPTVYEIVGSCIVFSTCFVGIAEEYCQWKKEDRDAVHDRQRIESSRIN